MRKHELAASALTVFIGTDRFRPVPEPYAETGTYSSAYPTDVNQELQEWAIKVLERIYREGFEYRKAGIVLSGLVAREKLAVRIFDDERFVQRHKLIKAVDEINRKFGRDTVRFGGVRTDGGWKMKQTRKSSFYTTDFQQLLQVK